jgi:hypothetical protein
MATVSAKATAKRLRTGPTFIQRSRAVSSEQKAIYHNVLGAGGRGVIREFFGVSESESEDIGQKLHDLIAARLGQ